MEFKYLFHYPKYSHILPSALVGSVPSRSRSTHLLYTWRIVTNSLRKLSLRVVVIYIWILRNQLCFPNESLDENLALLYDPDQ